MSPATPDNGQSGADGAGNPAKSGVRITQFDLTLEQVSLCLPDYDVTRIVGSGAMGVVYEASHRALQRRVALKILPPGLAAREATIQRFLREAEIVAKIHHENIVPIYDVGSRAGLHFIAMRFVPGVSLDRAVNAAPLSPREVAEIGVSVARALGFAHKHGIVHRDVKPANILREPDGRVSLTDFGLARVEGTGTMTESGALVGTPNYMSPEQIQGSRDSVDGRSDLYSLGVTLYELLTGRPPFMEETTAGTLRSILDKPAPKIRKFRPDCPLALETILLKAMRKDPLARYPNASAFAEDLERYLAGQPILAKRESHIVRGWRFVKANRGAFIAGSVAVLMGLGATYLLYQNYINKYEDALTEARALLSEVTPEKTDRVDVLREKLRFAHGLDRTKSRACRLGIQLAQKLGSNFPDLYETALNDTAQILDDPALPDEERVYYLYHRGRFALWAKKADIAHDCAKKAHALAPAHVRTATLSAILSKEAGRSFQQQGDDTEAMTQWRMAKDLLEKALVTEDASLPRDAMTEDQSEMFADAHLELGSVYKLMITTEPAMRAENIAKAREHYQRAATLSPRNADLHVLMAELSREEGNESNASIEEALAKAINPFVSFSGTTPVLGQDLRNAVQTLGDTFRGILAAPDSKPTSQPASKKAKPI